MNIYINEVLAAHVAIENWLSKGEGELELLLERFSPHYSMITLSGARLDREALSHFFLQQRASRPGLKIVVDQFSVLHEGNDGAVLLYQETQTQSDKEMTIRWSTAVLNLKQEKPVWLHLHETLQP
ncbi:cytoplasmic protein [bacteria symbiont BFo1 of Frankliniella occidentalis]|jgi:hypothetical protein|uniref:DUF4440 domain-containing protein n=1 Tax=Erwinia aphidicola TaxID=68334 RepID=A0ABU8DIS0_ERWAP|nr:hypothetical protein AI28_11870 [bacteria symbiont BFo1 of Frankliniella occidentalis]KYP82885.1 cytoplasmic protein [bacteria symbiont BFo1 of Frankliniella occidentalis]KYP87577.1 cytoplasmic protein [bacteria symbiont BFo1 of Frankliniella occidentalis]